MLQFYHLVFSTFLLILNQLNGNLIFDYELLVKLLKYALKLMPNRFLVTTNSLDKL